MEEEEESDGGTRHAAGRCGRKGSQARALLAERTRALGCFRGGKGNFSHQGRVDGR